VNLRRLNHILIPSVRGERDRLRRHWALWPARPVAWIYGALSREGRVVLVIWLLAGMAGLQVDASQVYILWCALTGLLLAGLLWRRAFALDEVRLRVEVPPRVALGETVTLSVVAENRGERPHHALRIERPYLPWDGEYVGAQAAIADLAGGGAVRVPIRARFSQRGEHQLDPVVMGALVPLGLTMGSRIESEGQGFIVLPRIAPVTRLHTPLAQRYQPGGVALASRTGESLEFVGVRPYQAGDPMRDLHARSWARRGQPVVRHYEQEYFTRIGIVLDTDGRVATEETIEAAISLAAGVVAHLSRGEALIDLLVVGDQIHQLTLGRSLGTLDQALDLLACVKTGPRLVSANLAASLAPHLRRLSSVIFVALAWDEDRQALTAQIRERGVGCRVLLVQAEGKPALAAPKLTALSVSAITSSEELAL